MVLFLITTTMNPWLTDTAEGSFVPTLIDVLRRTVEECVAVVRSGRAG